MDAYSNLTIKHVFALKWITKYCPGIKYVLKADDDVIVNLSYLQEILEISPMKRALLGRYTFEQNFLEKIKTDVSTIYEIIAAM